MKVNLLTNGARFVSAPLMSKQANTPCSLQSRPFEKSIYSGNFNVSADYYQVSFGVSPKSDLEIQPMSKEKAIEKHKRIFSDKPNYLAFAPGRCVLLGEHVDNYGGQVMPFAINAGTLVTASRRNDTQVFAYSDNQKSYMVFDLSKPLDVEGYKQGEYDGRWGNYVEGMVRKITEATGNSDTPRGMNLYINGNIPGSGLSSSASLEMAVGKAALAIYDADMDKKKLAKLGQETEHEFAKVMCGIMDQTASACSKEGTVLALDCRNNNTANIPANFDGYSIIICDSKIKHSLENSPYNEIVDECKSALEKLNGMEPFKDLEYIANIDLRTFRENLPDIKKTLTESEFRRVRHIVTETYRTHQCAEALRNGDIKYVGELMKQTHDSLSRDMRVSVDPVDELQRIAVYEGGAVGSRIMGGGFGGNIISIVPDKNVQRFVNAVTNGYYKPNYPNEKKPPVFIVKPAQGAYTEDLR